MTAKLTPEQTAHMLGVAPSTLRSWRFENRGPAFVRLSSRCFRYDEADVQRYISECRIDPSARARLEKTHYASR